MKGEIITCISNCPVDQHTEVGAALVLLLLFMISTSLLVYRIAQNSKLKRSYETLNKKCRNLRRKLKSLQ